MENFPGVQKLFFRVSPKLQYKKIFICLKKSNTVESVNTDGHICVLLQTKTLKVTLKKNSLKIARGQIESRKSVANLPFERL